MAWDWGGALAGAGLGFAAAPATGGLSVYGGLLAGGMMGNTANQAANSARDINAQQMALSDKQMAFQEYMSSTAHQREVADLRKAGLNPILSATGGSGASTPGGSMAILQNPDVNQARDRSLIGNLNATTAKVLSEAMLNKEMAKTEGNKRDLLDAQKDAAGGSLITPAGSMPWTRVANLFSSGINSAKSALKKMEDSAGNYLSKQRSFA